MSNLPDKETFLKDVSNHVLTIIKDEPPYRHIRLSIPGSSNMRYDLITWPGYLCYTGDMGTYVFSRLNDMFDFFRQKEGVIAINKGYWREKLQAVDCEGSSSEGRALQFSYEKFKQIITEYLDDVEASKELRKEVYNAVILGDENAIRCYDRAYEFRSEVNPDFAFIDLFERDTTEYTYHFIWCCYALVWGINQYDQYKILAEAAA